MSEKNIIILRGCSNNGKSSFAKLLCKHRGTVSVEADKFFTHEDGSYHFDASLLGRAHLQCQETFKKFLAEPSVEVIVVSNTNCSPRDMKFYEDEANKRGYRVTYLVLERRHDNINSHGVPENVLANQEEKLRNSLKLR